MILVLLGGAKLAAASSYTITDLGTLGGDYVHSNAYGINNTGQVTGYSYKMPSGDGLAFFWDGTMHNLGIPSGDYYRSTGKDLNGSGVVVGYAETTDHVRQAVLYDNAAGTWQELGTLGAWEQSYAEGINDAGQVVGYRKGPGYSHAFRYDGGTMTNLGTPLWGSYTEAYAINNSGQIVGRSGSAFLYDSGNWTNLGTLGGGYSTAYDINDAGRVVGSANLAGDAVWHAFLHDGTSITDLGSLGDPDSASSASGINEAGQVVGYYEGSTGYRAFLYDQGTMYDLNSFDIAGIADWDYLRWAQDINDSGQIVGHGRKDGNVHAFLMTPTAEPIPEPATMLLLGAGLVGLVGSRKKIYRRGRH